MAGRGPDLLAGIFIEGDDAGFFAADVDQEMIAFQERRCGHAEKAPGNLVFRVERPVPDLPAGLQLQAGEPAFRSQSVNALARDQGGRARALVEAELIHITSRIGKLPLFLAAGGIEASNILLVADTVKKDQPLAGYHRAAETGPD